ncbi:MAG: sensor histidine kinase [Myxococcota bacterium]
MSESPTSRGWARWGLLATTLGLGAALLATSVASWSSAREASRAVERARGADMAFAVRRALRVPPDERPAVLEEVLADHAEEGLRYVAVVASGRIRHVAGTPAGSVDPETLPPRHGFSREGDRVRVVAPLGPPRHRRHARHRRPDFPRIVLEFEPVASQALRARATRTLVVGGASALLLVVAGLVFWRLSARARQAERRLARDRHLAALGEMSAVLGHELRNPLASLKGHAQLLEERLPEGSRERDKAARVVAEAVRLEHLSGQVLDFARSGDVTREASDPGALLRAAAESVRGAEVRVDASEAPDRWSLDRLRMEQVLSNVLANAAQAGPPDAAVEASARREGDRLVFTIRDHGPGIRPGDEEHIFEPFRTGRIRGTGLGLAVARRIVEAHGGRITATNHPEGGAVFRVEVPR